jgi:hypothetical protein
MKKYYLLGTEACRIYFEDGFESLVRKAKDGLAFALFYYHPERCTQEQLEEALEGYHIHVLLSEEQYERLESLDD